MEALSGDGFVHSRRVRWGACTFVAVAALAAAMVGAKAHTADAYLTIWAAAGLILVVPSAVLAPAALRDTEVDRTAVRAWYSGMAAIYLVCGLVFLVGVRDWGPGKPVLLVVTGLGIAAFSVGNALALRAESGQRAVEVDVVDLLVVTVAVLGPFAMVAARPIVRSPDEWLAVPAALFAICGLHAIVTLVLSYLRSGGPPEVEWVMYVVMLAASTLDAAAMVGQCLTHFGLPPGPLVGLHIVTMSNGLLTGAFVARGGPDRGLASLPPQRQVRRRNGPLALLVVTSVLAMVVIAGWRRDDAWTVTTAVGVLACLVVLATLRQVGLARETVRLYGAVERAADERRGLLEEVMSYIDGDRSRAAAQIHRQAARLYTSMALSAQADSVASHMRVDLARQVDMAHEVLTAMRTTPEPASPEGLQRLAGVIRAYVGVLYGDSAPPTLEVDITEGLVADWLDEAVAFRIVQVALHNVWRHAQASTVRVTIGECDGALVVAVVDDGLGFDPKVTGTGIVTLHALAQLVGGRVDVDTSPGAGTRVHAVLAGPPPPPRPGGPTLRLISGGRTPPVHT